MKSELYCDGGVIGHNPSEDGGTWAWCLIDDGEMTASYSGVIIPEGMETPAVSNNQTEMLAVLMGLEVLPDDWYGTIYSDSQVTLGRIFDCWKMTNIPVWMQRRLHLQQRRLKNWYRLKRILLAGHPTRKQLEEGKGRHNLPVSQWNVWCDHECGRMASEFINVKGMMEIMK